MHKFTAGPPTADFQFPREKWCFTTAGTPLVDFPHGIVLLTSNQLQSAGLRDVIVAMIF